MNKFLNIILLIQFISFLGCASSTSVNQVTSAEFLIQGSLKDGSDDKLIHTFKRTSFFQEITMVLDVMSHKIDSNDPLMELMDESEKKQFENCPNFYILFLYAPVGGRLKTSEFFSDFTQGKISKVSLGRLKKYLQMGPTFIQQGLMQYEFSGACMKNATDVSIQVPGFRTISDLF